MSDILPNAIEASQNCINASFLLPSSLTDCLNFNNFEEMELLFRFIIHNFINFAIWFHLFKRKLLRCPPPPFFAQMPPPTWGQISSIWWLHSPSCFFVAWWHSETCTIKITEMPPTFFAEMLSKKIAEMPPPLLLLGELRKKICAKQKIGEGVVNC